MLSLWRSIVEGQGENWRYLLDAALQEIGNNEVAQNLFQHDHDLNGLYIGEVFFFYVVHVTYMKEREKHVNTPVATFQ